MSLYSWLLSETHYRLERLSKRNVCASKKLLLAATAHALLYKIISTLAWQILNHIFCGKLQLSSQNCQFIVRTILSLLCFVKVKYLNISHPHDHTDREVRFVTLHQSHIYLHGHWLIIFFSPLLSRRWGCEIIYLVVYLRNLSQLNLFQFILFQIEATCFQPLAQECRVEDLCHTCWTKT